MNHSTEDVLEPAVMAEAIQETDLIHDNFVVEDYLNTDEHSWLIIGRKDEAFEWEAVNKFMWSNGYFPTETKKNYRKYVSPRDRGYRHVSKLDVYDAKEVLDK